eukprot:334767-Rhodomonas_salina.1
MHLDTFCASAAERMNRMRSKLYGTCGHVTHTPGHVTPDLWSRHVSSQRIFGHVTQGWSRHS